MKKNASRRKPTNLHKKGDSCEPPFWLGFVVDGRLLTIDLGLLFLAGEVDICEGVDDLDDAWGEAVASGLDVHDYA